VLDASLKGRPIRDCFDSPMSQNHKPKKLKMRLKKKPGPCGHRRLRFPHRLGSEQPASARFPASTNTPWGLIRRSWL